MLRTSKRMKAKADAVALAATQSPPWSPPEKNQPAAKTSKRLKEKADAVALLAATQSPPEKKQTTAQAKTKKKKKQPAAKSKSNGKIITHADDGTAIVNATISQIRKGWTGKSTPHLVRIPQVAERSKFYAEAAEVIGERESLALPYHGGRMWKCEVKVSDENGACGTNRKGKNSNNTTPTNDDDDEPKKKKSNYKSLTPLFRWYRGDLVLATLPYILQDIVEVHCKMPSKKRWANGMSDDEGLDSSDEEWDDDAYKVEPATKMTMEVSALTAAAYEDSSHPLPHISRSWISPDLLRFSSRKSAMLHSEELVKRDLLIDRTLYGYGHNGVRLRPVKPTRKSALEAGNARFLRDGLWIVGQEEMWVEKRREVLVKKMERREVLVREEEDEEHDDGGDDELEEENLEVDDDDDHVVLEDETESKVEDAGKDIRNSKSEDASVDVSKDEESQVSSKSKDVATSKVEEPEESSKVDDTKVATNEAVMPESEDSNVASSSIEESNESSNVEDTKVATNEAVMSNDARSDDCAQVVSPPESEDSTDEVSAKTTETNNNDAAINNAMVVKHANRSKPPPAFIPSTHYRLNKKQIDKCYSACIDHYESVMRTVSARSLHHELADGFDVLRERGRGRFDMELPGFDDAEEYSFLTDPRKAAWMPIVREILGDDATLVHKGCFMSLPGSETQVYHQDGVHLNKKTHKPCYAINVFIPLVDYDMKNGPTEFCLGTHYLGCENFIKENVYTPCVTAGTPVIFDYRLGHRGLRNYSQDVRPVVYLTYSSVASGKEFRDSVNFSRKRYHKLGDFAEKPLSREERAQKRRRQEET